MLDVHSALMHGTCAQVLGLSASLTYAVEAKAIMTDIDRLCDDLRIEKVGAVYVMCQQLLVVAFTGALLLLPSASICS